MFWTRENALKPDLNPLIQGPAEMSRYQGSLSRIILTFLLIILCPPLVIAHFKPPLTVLAFRRAKTHPGLGTRKPHSPRPINDPVTQP